MGALPLGAKDFRLAWGAWGLLWVPWGALGGPLGLLGVPWGVLGVPWLVLGGFGGASRVLSEAPLRSLGGP